MAFSLNGGMAALAGIVFASQIGFIPNQTGTGLEMKAIAACVLGISLLGGSGTVIGAILGAYFLTQIDSVLVLLRIPPGGTILLLAGIVGRTGIRWAAALCITTQSAPPEICPFYITTHSTTDGSKTHAQQNKNKEVA